MAYDRTTQYIDNIASLQHKGEAKGRMVMAVINTTCIVINTIDDIFNLNHPYSFDQTHRYT